ncbi:uncharacterized protein LOC124896857 [Capsicum annuum]|uniref:uncharacterized protein LOC124896857 n=1 Tax=Capsicum annuum TaxID=4072 RepID=UPI001FB16E9B|nr:uncharacterized protein LOC124896857 [Capsicum annuum]
MSLLPDFRFHPMCKDQRLTHLVFADDLMIFYKGNVASVNGVVEALKHFNAVTGLEANLEKSSIFLAGVKDNIRDQILAMTGFSIGKLPIRYLGLPLSHRKWRKMDCHALVGKITERINVTNSKKLSYAGRLQVVNVVLFSIHSFWGAAFILPQQESLWVRWVHEIYIKEDSSIWEHKAPVDSSWYWRKFNDVKQLMKDWYVQDKYRLIQDGSYSISRRYMELIGRKPKLRIAEYIWTSIALPKHRFVVWLAVQGRLLTQKRKLKLNIQVDNANCCLCVTQELESRVHLFEECAWVKNVWAELSN